LKDRQKFLYRLNIEKNGTNSPVDPVVYWSDFNERKSPIIEPGIKSFFTEDLYLVLKSSDYDKIFKTNPIKESETIKCFLDTNISITLNKFEMQKTDSKVQDNPLLGAQIKYILNGIEIDDTIFTAMKSTSEFKDIIWKKIPNTDYDIAFWSFLPSQEANSLSEASLTFKKSNEAFVEPLEILTMEASFKPFISFVWIGVMIIVIGFIISFIKNLNEKNEKEQN
jgi:cytochrome c-type biogenesis protein CcmF